MVPVIVLWVIGAILIGFLGRRYRFGFWGYFFATILLTPIVGVLLLAAAVPTRDTSKAHRRP